MNIPLKHTYSSISTFETCPWRWYSVRHTQRWADEMGEAAKIGDAGHKALEARMKFGTALPQGWEWLEGISQSIPAQINEARMSMAIEQKIAINRWIQPCDYYAPDYMIRGKIDLMALGSDRAVIDDFKFGKRRPSEQLKTYALMVMANYPNVQKVKTQFLWVHEPHAIDIDVYPRSELPKMTQGLMGKIIQIEQAVTQNVFVKRPSGLCKNYCPVFDCEHNGRRIK